MDSKIARIKELKSELDVEILAHYYQTLDIQDLADHIGDSLALAMLARDKVKSSNIIFCAVRFMGETAAILNPTRRVFIPAPNAECPMAKQINPSMIELARKKYPGLPLVVYVNTTAETKAFADACCTSSNVLQIVNAIAKEWGTESVILAPDSNLAANTNKLTNINVIGYPDKGCCPTHNLYSVDDVEKTLKLYPNAKLIVHPEAPSEVVDLSHFAGSTAQLLKYCEKENPEGGFIIGTEIEFIQMLKRKYPNKKFYPLNSKADCPNMKKVNVDNVLRILENLKENNGFPEGSLIKLEDDIIKKAAQSINKMFELMKK